MALGALSLSVTQGVQGRRFAAKINGLTTGKVEVLGYAGSPGFSTVNGMLYSNGLPYPVSTVVLREYQPGVGAGYLDMRIDITATTPYALLQQANAAIGGGRTLKGYRVAGTVQGDGSIVYSLYVTDDLGATTVQAAGAAAASLKVVPIDANNAYVIMPNTATGGAIRYHLGRNQGSAADGADLGTLSPAWRVQGVADMASSASDPNSPLGIWSEDVGNQHYAFNFNGPFGGGYHGIGSTGSVVQSVTVNGVVVDLTIAGTYAGPLAITSTETIAFAGNTIVAPLTTTIGLDGTYSYTFGDCTQTAALSYFYAGMNIGSGNYSEADVLIGGTLYRMPAVSDRGVVPASTRVRMRNIDDGRTIDYVSNAPSIGGFSRKEVDRYAGLNRTKTYDRFTGNVNQLAGLTVTMTFGRGTAGATTFAANLITNGSFTADVSGWTQTSGTATWVSGKAQQTSSATVQQKLTQLVSGLDTTAPYLVTVNADSAVATTVAYALGINTNGSTSGANVNQSTVVGINSVMFTPTQAQLQMILLELTGAAGVVVNWDDVSLIKLAAAA